jgi:hypothetical protein
MPSVSSGDASAPMSVGKTPNENGHVENGNVTRPGRR